VRTPARSACGIIAGQPRFFASRSPAAEPGRSGLGFRLGETRLAGKKMLSGRVAQAELGYRQLDPASAAPARTSPLS
jgi:hypothetical protein